METTDAKIDEMIERLFKDMGNIAKSQNDLSKSLDKLHTDHLELTVRVNLTEKEIANTKSQLDVHELVAEGKLSQINVNIGELKELISGHLHEENEDRKKLIEYLNRKVDKGEQSWKEVLLWIIGTSIVVLGLTYQITSGAKDDVGTPTVIEQSDSGE